jgi:alginate O-acetyltransferase complex protein AlgI
MLFNTIEFVAFFVIVTAVYWLLKHRWQNLFLLAASYFFYSAWDYRFLSLIILSTLIYYFSGIKIYESTNPKKRKILLAVSITCSLLILGVFKYFNFFAENLQLLLNSIGLGMSIGRLKIILPVGISFYTFQSMSYAFDIYRGQLKPTRNFLDLALFVSFYPQLFAGPINRASKLLPQVIGERYFSQKQFVDGLRLIVWGLFMKMFVADNMARIVEYVFTVPVASQTGLEIFLGIIAFTFRIYGDFAGYSDIARGVAKCMGFEIMVNFKRPYFALSPSEFWSRWHISLSSWLRDYLYMPLANRYGMRYRNIIFTMFIAGFWHGAGWTFIAWGLFHGTIQVVYIIIYRLFADPMAEKTEESFIIRKLSSVLRWFILMILVLFSWLLFGAESMSQVRDMLVQIFTSWHITPLAVMFMKHIIFFCWFLVLVDAWDFMHENKSRDTKAYQFGLCAQTAFYVYVIASIILFGVFEETQFIYFQF